MGFLVVLGRLRAGDGGGPLVRTSRHARQANRFGARLLLMSVLLSVQSLPWAAPEV